MGKKRKHSTGSDPAAEVLRPLVLAHPGDQGHGPTTGRDKPTVTGPRGAALGPRRRGPLDGGPGAHLCYGEPVQVGDRAVIPVASVRTPGGWGRGDRSDDAAADADGRGGLLGARPIGYIEVNADGSRYVALPSPRRRFAVVAGLAALAGAGLTLLVLRRGRVG